MMNSRLTNVMFLTVGIGATAVALLWDPIQGHALRFSIYQFVLLLLGLGAIALSIPRIQQALHALLATPTQMERIALTGLSGFLLTWCIASLWFPFGWDHGFFASVGDVIVQGGMPYRDAWEIKGPLPYYLFAAAQWIFGRHMWAIRIMDVALLLIACVMMARMTARITSASVGRWTSVGFALWYASLTWFYLSQPDGWVALLMLLGVGPLVAQHDRVGPRWLGWCALLIGCCALVKPFYAAFLLVPVVFILSAPWPVSRRARAVVVVGMTAAIPPLLTLAWFAYQGALDALIEVQFIYNPQVYSGIGRLRPGPVLDKMFDYLWTGGNEVPGGKIAVLLPAIVFGVYTLWRTSRQIGLTLATWLGVALFCVAIQGKFWVYHWIPTFPPLAVLGTFGLWKLSSSVSSLDRPSPGKVFSLIAAAAFIVQVMVTPAADVGRWLQLLGGFKTHEAYYTYHAQWKYVASDEMKAARYIRERTSNSDGVVIWGNDATVSFLSGRPNPTRFVYAMPLTRGGPASFLADYRREFMKGLSAKPPAYFVVGLPHASSNKEAVLNDFPELVNFLQSHYRLETQIGFLDLYHFVQ